VGEDLSDAWGRIEARLRTSVSASTFDLWFAGLHPLSARGDTLYLTGRRQQLGWVERRYPDILGSALETSGTSFREFRFVPEGEADPGSADAGAGDAGSRGVLNPTHTFDRFVIGAGNRVAHGAALAVAEAPGEAYNPLFLHGLPGLGKTHLLGAIARYLGDHSPDLAVHYTTAECFTSQFIFALHGGSIDSFKQRYRQIDVLLIDDVQFLEGKSRTADEFFHTFNELYEAGAQIVLSADRLPLHLSELAERLRQRFEWGLTVALDPPDLRTRRTVIERLMMDRDEQLETEILHSMASRDCSNLRLLEGNLTRVLALSSLTGSPVTAELLTRALPLETASGRSARPDIGQIQELVAQRLHLSPADLVSSSRTAPVTRARQLGMHLARELTGLSLPAIAREFGRRDHTTVIHALRQVRRRLDLEPDYRAMVTELTNQLNPDPTRL
jgi:chromosomal replication initiator protein